MIKDIELSIIERLKDEDISAVKKIISRNEGIFETYMECSNDYSLDRRGSAEYYLQRKDVFRMFSDALTDIVENNELIIRDFMKFLNKRVEVTLNTQFTVVYMIYHLTTRYVLDKKCGQKFLTCMSLIFEYMTNILTKDIIRDVLHNAVLLTHGNHQYLQPNIYSILDLEILDIYLPHIDVHAPFKIDRFCNTNLITALKLRPAEIEYHCISFINILLAMEEYETLLHIKETGKLLDDGNCDMCFSWTCFKYILNAEQQIEDATHNSVQVNLIRRLKKCIDYSNLKDIAVYKNIFSSDSEWIKKNELALSKINWDVRLEYNVSPLVMCTSIEAAKFLLQHNVNKDNYNGLFYIFLNDDEELFMFMMRNGVDPVPTIRKFKNILKNNDIREELKLTYELFIRCYNNHKAEMIKMLRNNKYVCNDVVKTIVNVYL